jgi:5-methylcytosine-specific restriction endonuclease McrA
MEQAESVEVLMHTFGTDPRSSKWEKVRNDFIKLNPTCAACGTTEDLNVHHIVPFHDDESKELDPTNLITLCRTHHFGVGHDSNWKKSNPNVKIDSEMIRRSKTSGK